LYRNSGKK
jgi:hypothetical protein